MKNALTIGLLVLALEIHAQLRYYPPNPNKTPQQQAADVTARQQAEERQYQIEQQRQQIADQVGMLNHDILEKSNNLQRLLKPKIYKIRISL